MEGCRGSRNPAVCRFWVQGKCNRTPCNFIHSDASSSRKRPNPDQDCRERKRYTWKRNQVGGDAGTVMAVGKKVCDFWANGNCLYGDNCRDLHSWFTGSGFKFVAELEGHKEGLRGLCFSDKDGFSGSKDGCFKVWDCNSGQCVSSSELGCEIGCMLDDAPWLFVGLDNRVKAWNLDDQTEFDFHLSNGDGGGLIRSLAFDVDTLFGGAEDGSIFVWKLGSTLPTATYKGHHLAVLSLYVGKGAIFSASMDNTVRVWWRETSKCLHVLDQHTASVTSVLGWESYLITASLDHSVKMWASSSEDRTLQVVRQVEDESSVLALKGIYDKDGNPILLCSRSDNTIRLLNLPTLTERGRIFTKAPVHTISIDNSAKNRLFFTGNATGRLQVWTLD